MKAKMREAIDELSKARAAHMTRVCPVCRAPAGAPCKDEHGQDYGGVHYERQRKDQR